MFHQLLRSLSSRVEKQNLGKKMAKVRYFPNPTPDYEQDKSEPLVTMDYLTKFAYALTIDIEKKVKLTRKTSKDGLYLGTAGIAYMYYHLYKIPALSQYRSTFISKAAEYLESTLKFIPNEETSMQDVPSFILGNCGVYALASVLYSAVGNKPESDTYRQKYYEAGNICKKIDFLSCGSDELFVGRAGYILGALWLAKETNTDIQRNDIYTLCNIMIESGRKYSRRHNSPSPLMYAYYDVEYLGAAHGLCSILQVLLSVPEYLDRQPSNAVLVKASVDYLLSLQDDEGNFPCDTDTGGSGNDLVHWCHGAGGMVYLMAKAFLVWNEEKYLNSCKKMADLVWEKGLLKKGPGICHGVAGNGYVFLILYRLTEHPKYLYRASAFAQFIKSETFVTKARTPDNPFSLYEGVAGTACFLADLTNPKQATFPFSDVFS